MTTPATPYNPLVDAISELVRSVLPLHVLLMEHHRHTPPHEQITEMVASELATLPHPEPHWPDEPYELDEELPDAA
jgi:hypothetical protein